MSEFSGLSSIIEAVITLDNSIVHTDRLTWRKQMKVREAKEKLRAIYNSIYQYILYNIETYVNDYFYQEFMYPILTATLILTPLYE